MYLLSSIAQGLAAVLALVVTMTLVYVQLASQQFTPQVIRLKLRDLYFWGLIGLYIFTILMALMLMAGRAGLKSTPWIERFATDVCVLLAGASFTFLVPYTFETMNSMKPAVFVRKLLQRGDTAALEEVLQKTINEGLRIWTNETCSLIMESVEEEMKTNQSKEKRLRQMEEAAACFLNAGKRACRENEREILRELMNRLTSLTKKATKLTLREEADVFNRAVLELYEYAQEQEGR